MEGSKNKHMIPDPESETLDGSNDSVAVANPEQEHKKFGDEPWRDPWATPAEAWQLSSSSWRRTASF